jgi:hypothetical protein
MQCNRSHLQQATPVGALRQLARQRLAPRLARSTQLLLQRADHERTHGHQRVGQQRVACVITGGRVARVRCVCVCVCACVRARMWVRDQCVRVAACAPQNTHRRRQT